jgi:hypothetical protein
MTAHPSQFQPGVRAAVAALRARSATISCVSVVVVALAAPVLWAHQATPPSAPQQLARSIFKELIEINTTDSSGDTTRAAEAMAARLQAAGFPAGDVQVLGPTLKGNLVARLRGNGAGKPILLLAHLDVVEALREDWSVDPFVFLERDGYLSAVARRTSSRATLCSWLTSSG